MKKQFIVKIYSLAGTFLKTINPDKVKSEVSFTTKINGFQGECVLDIDLPIDNFDEGSSIETMNIIRIFEADDENHTTPTLIYAGYISQYVPYFSDGVEGVRLILLGLGSLLSLDYFKSGSSFTVVKNSDPSQMMKDIIDHFSTIYPSNILSYTGSSVDTVGVASSYTFTDKKWSEALKAAADLGGTNWFWMIDQSGVLYFKQKPSSATHQFTLGSDAQSGECPKNSEQIINAVQLRWGSPATNTDYSDANSITQYGRHASIITDSAIGDIATANQRGNKEINDKKDKKAQAKLKINTNYDIESIKVGDTCSVFNSKKDSTVFPINMLITSIQYSPDYVDIELENTKSTFADSFAEAVNRAL